MKTKICPKCGVEHNLDVDYCGCGHKWKKNSVQSIEHDPMHGCCEVTSMAGRCHYPGVHSDSTVGGGPWKCSKHYQDSNFEHTDDIIRESQDRIPNADYSIESRRNMSNKEYRKSLVTSDHLNSVDRKRIADSVGALVNRYRS